MASGGAIGISFTKSWDCITQTYKLYYQDKYEVLKFVANKKSKSVVVKEPRPLKLIHSMIGDFEKFPMNTSQERTTLKVLYTTSVLFGAMNYALDTLDSMYSPLLNGRERDVVECLKVCLQRTLITNLSSMTANDLPDDYVCKFYNALFDMKLDDSNVHHWRPSTEYQSAKCTMMSIKNGLNNCMLPENERAAAAAAVSNPVRQVINTLHETSQGRINESTELSTIITDKRVQDLFYEAFAKSGLGKPKVQPAACSVVILDDDDDNVDDNNGERTETEVRTDVMVTTEQTASEDSAISVDIANAKRPSTTTTINLETVSVSTTNKPVNVVKPICAKLKSRCLDLDGDDDDDDDLMSFSSAESEEDEDFEGEYDEAEVEADENGDDEDEDDVNVDNDATTNTNTNATTVTSDRDYYSDVSVSPEPRDCDLSKLSGLSQLSGLSKLKESIGGVGRVEVAVSSSSSVAVAAAASTASTASTAASVTAATLSAPDLSSASSSVSGESDDDNDDDNGEAKRSSVDVGGVGVRAKLIRDKLIKLVDDHLKEYNSLTSKLDDVQLKFQNVKNVTNFQVNMAMIDSPKDVTNVSSDDEVIDVTSANLVTVDLVSDDEEGNGEAGERNLDTLSEPSMPKPSTSAEAAAAAADVVIELDDDDDEDEDDDVAAVDSHTDSNAAAGGGEDVIQVGDVSSDSNGTSISNGGSDNVVVVEVEGCGGDGGGNDSNASSEENIVVVNFDRDIEEEEREAAAVAKSPPLSAENDDEEGATTTASNSWREKRNIYKARMEALAERVRIRRQQEAAIRERKRKARKEKRRRQMQQQRRKHQRKARVEVATSSTVAAAAAASADITTATSGRIEAGTSTKVTMSFSLTHTTRRERLKRALFGDSDSDDDDVDQGNVRASGKSINPNSSSSSSSSDDDGVDQPTVAKRRRFNVESVDDSALVVQNPTPLHHQPPTAPQTQTPTAASSLEPSNVLNRQSIFENSMTELLRNFDSNMILKYLEESKSTESKSTHCDDDTAAAAAAAAGGGGGGGVDAEAGDADPKLVDVEHTKDETVAAVDDDDETKEGDDDEECNEDEYDASTSNTTNTTTNTTTAAIDVESDKKTMIQIRKLVLRYQQVKARINSLDDTNITMLCRLERKCEKILNKFKKLKGLKLSTTRLLDRLALALPDHLKVHQAALEACILKNSTKQLTLPTVAEIEQSLCVTRRVAIELLKCCIETFKAYQSHEDIVSLSHKYV